MTRMEETSHERAVQYTEDEYPSILKIETMQDLIDATLVVEKRRAFRKKHSATVKVDDMVSQPEHYHLEALGIDAMDVIKAVLERDFGEDGWKAFCKGNMLKYLLRNKWSPDEDVAKSGRYSVMYTGENISKKR